MAETFLGLGLRSELADVTMEMGYTEPTTLQRDAIPILRRGGNAVLYASAGSGVMAAYGLPLLDRVADEEVEGPRALVVVPTAHEAVKTAESLARLAAAVGLRVAALGPGWAHSARDADLVVTAPSAAVQAIGTSALKLGGVRVLVLDGLSELYALGADEAVETLTNSVPRERQQIVVTAESTDEVDDYVERHVRRALRIPAQPVDTGRPAPEPKHELDYTVVDEADKLAALASHLSRHGSGRRAVVYCRGEERAAPLAESITLRGFLAVATGSETAVDTAIAQAAATTAEVEPEETVSGELAGSADIVVTWRDGEVGGEVFAISYDVPFDDESLARRHPDGGLVLVTSREVSHLRQIAERAQYELRSRPVAVTDVEGDELAGYRSRVERAVATEDVAAQLLVLEPLFETYSAAEVAAALSALLRRRDPEPEERVVDAVVGAPPVKEAPPAFVRLFVGVGGRENVRPGDLVGAITGETGADGDQVGRIEIRDNFSIVEVARPIADAVIRALNGTTIKGRSVRVDYDRGASGGRRGGRPGPRRDAGRPGARRGPVGRGERPRRGSGGGTDRSDRSDR